MLNCGERIGRLGCGKGHSLPPNQKTRGDCSWWRTVSVRWSRLTDAKRRRSSQQNRRMVVMLSSFLFSLSARCSGCGAGAESRRREGRGGSLSGFPRFLCGAGPAAGFGEASGCEVWRGIRTVRSKSSGSDYSVGKHMKEKMGSAE
jgi:hypothetical protein